MLLQSHSGRTTLGGLTRCPERRAAVRHSAQRPLKRGFSIFTESCSICGRHQHSACAAAATPSTIALSAPTHEVPTTRGLGGTLPDVIWGPGSSAEQICRSLQRLAQRQRIALAARVDSDMAVAVQKLLPDAEYNACGHVLTFRSEHLLLGGRLPPKAPRLPGTVALVMGKAADAAVAEECRAVGEHLGCYVYRVSDSSAAGLQGAATTADVVVVVVAGCDTALPSMVASLVDAPVIAVPTSEDHKTSYPCAAATASGVTVVAMDDGLGAAVMATRMLRMASKLHSARMAALSGAAASASA